MSVCSVKWCGRTSRTSNVKKDGITFHRFPRDPEMSAKWIEATRREKWMPKVSSVLCSRHFMDDCFIICPQTQRRRLFKDAVPTLHLPVMTFQPIDAYTQTTESVHNETKQIQPDLQSPDDDLAKRLHRTIHEQSRDITAKDKKIKQLRDKLRWAEKKVVKLEATVKEYKNTGVVIRSSKLNKNKAEGKKDNSSKSMENKSIHIIRL